jgi:hypothetical protein
MAIRLQAECHLEVNWFENILKEVWVVGVSLDFLPFFFLTSCVQYTPELAMVPAIKQAQRPCFQEATKVTRKANEYRHGKHLCGKVRRQLS